MGTSGSWFAALLCFLSLGVEVLCVCTENGLQIQGGNYTLSRELGNYSLLIYHCHEEGYYPYPVLTRICQPNGSWRPAPKRFSPQRCRRVECPDPNVLENGNVYPPQDRYFVDNETSYECYSGYTMRGSSKRICLNNGKWSGSTPICSRDTGDVCADPGIPPGASRGGHMFGIDDKVSYTCNSGLFLVGSRERVCLENGHWTGTEPACYYKHTYDTPREVSEAFGSAIKGTLTTTQSLNDTQEGRSIRISKNGTLNIYIAVDISESINKTEIDEARKAVITLIKKIASFSVSPNYEILFFSSEIYEVVNILDFFNAKLQLNSIIENLETFKIENRNTGTDLNLVFKTFDERMSFIEKQAGAGFKDHRHVLILFTDGAYNMGGSPLPTVSRIKNRVYMNSTVDKQASSRDEYLDIYVFAIGADIFDEDLQPLTAGTGNHYFRMSIIKELQETFDSIIDESKVVGLCGLHKDYETTFDKVSRRRRYPWLVFIINKGVKAKTCIGSLVSPDFVLTAAHCFTFGDEAQNIVVGIDDGSGSIEKKVRSFKLHPKYNLLAKVAEGVAEFYDYDVALLRLDEPVALSDVARPICIPCTQETSDALNLVGESTCRQQEQVLLKSHRERLSFLTRKAPLVEEKDVYAKLGENRNVCIKKALLAPGITTKDERVAVTDNFLCTGGRVDHRDHIACTGDSGGAVFKNYELRTIQIGVVSWGTHQLCGSTDGLIESNDDSRDFHINLFRVVPFLVENLGDDTQDYTALTFLKS